MIYIAVALGIEARPLIKKFKLKKDSTINRVQVFKNEKIILIVTGVGILKSAIALTYILSKVKIDSDDIFINIGICGAKNKEYKIGDIVLCNKIINSESKRAYYPDMIFDHRFKEGSLESFNRVINSESGVTGDLVDMEGAGLIEASSYFFETYQVNIIKIVSDYLDGDIDPESVENLIEKALVEIEIWLERRSEFHLEKELEFLDEERREVDSLIVKGRFSVTMVNELESLLLYYKLKGENLIKLIKNYDKIDMKDKKVTKKILEDIKNCVIGVKNER